MKKQFLKPARAGLVVRNPKTLQPLAEEGQSVTMTSYWRRRIADGDVVEAKPPKAPKTKGDAE